MYTKKKKKKPYKTAFSVIDVQCINPRSINHAQFPCPCTCEMPNPHARSLSPINRPIDRIAMPLFAKITRTLKAKEQTSAAQKTPGIVKNKVKPIPPNKIMPTCLALHRLIEMQV